MQTMPVKQPKGGLCQAVQLYVQVHVCVGFARTQKCVTLSTSETEYVVLEASLAFHDTR